MDSSSNGRQDRGYILSLDAGTSSVRAILYDSFGVAVAMAQRPLRLGFPQAGWVSQDAMEILSRSIACMVEVQVESGIHSDEIRAVGIANQRETVVVWDRASGQPIADAIVWQCRRTAPEVRKLVDAGYGPLVQEKTGLVIDPYFSATKIAWILDHVEGARERAERGELLAGTVDTWLVYNFTHGAVHATDYTNASRTMLFDIHTLSWSDELCELFRVPRAMLGEARPSDGDFGRVSSDIFSHHPPIAGVVGDQQSSLFGHLCFDAGMAKNTYGTGCFLLMNVGDAPVASTHGLLCTIGIAAGGRVSYALEGSVFQAGSVVQWLRDELGLIKSAEESAEVARSVPSTGGCYLVPAFTGLGAPWWASDARGTLTGLTRSTNGAQIVRAGLESIAYQSFDVLRAMEADCGMPVRELRVDGGAATNDFLMGFQADILSRPVVRPGAAERTALGAAYLAGLSVGYWQDVDDLAARQAGERRFEPSMGDAEREELLAGWDDAVHRTLA